MNTILVFPYSCKDISSPVNNSKWVYHLVPVIYLYFPILLEEYYLQTELIKNTPFFPQQRILGPKAFFAQLNTEILQQFNVVVTFF